MKKKIQVFMLFFLFLICIRLYAAGVITIPGLVKPDSITLFNDRLYVTDQARISIYSLPEARLIKTFGRAGEGPAEFRISPIDKIGLRIIVRNENILVNSWNKLSTFTSEGTFIDEKKVTVTPYAQFFKPFGKNYVGYSRANLDKVNYYFVHLFDSTTLQKVKDILHIKSFLTSHSIDPLRLAISLKNNTRRGPIYDVYNDRLFVEGEDCRILIYDLEGKELSSFTLHDYEKLKISEDFKKEIMAYLEKRLPTAFINVKRNGRFLSYFPLRFFLVADGQVFVQTFKSGKEKSEFYIFDLGGKLLRKVMVPFWEEDFLIAYPFTISKGKIYQLVENEDTEEWELHINKID